MAVTYMKTKLISLLLILAALTACAPFTDFLLKMPVAGTPSAMPDIVTSTPLPTSTPLVQVPADTSMPPTNTPLNPAIVPDPQFSSFHMTDATNGWAVGEKYLLRTADGGLTWLNVTPPSLAELGANVTGSHFLNASTAWLILLQADPMLVDLYHTTDGGLTWTTNPIPFDGGDMQFLDAQHGFVLTSLGAAADSQAVSIHQTSDGGLTWTRVFTNAPTDPAASDSLPFSGQKSGITFLDAAHGWVGGSIPMQSYLYLYTTLDGGLTWGKQDPPLPNGFESAMTEVDAPVFFTALDGVLPVRLLAEPSSFIFYVTHDAGLTWTPTFPLNVTAQYWMANLLDLFLWNGGPDLFVSHDTGLTWDRVETGINVVDSLVHYEFADALTGWMLTRDASGHTMFWKTTDGGAAWTVVIP
jgi:photosystem II stability/assembly factor-like uncharacterized protein